MLSEQVSTNSSTFAIWIASGNGCHVGERCWVANWGLQDYKFWSRDASAVSSSRSLKRWHESMSKVYQGGQVCRRRGVEHTCISTTRQ